VAAVLTAAVLVAADVLAPAAEPALAEAAGPKPPLLGFVTY
jgi:hypothetical protein